MKDIHFVVCCLQIVLSALLHLDRHIGVVLEVLGKPDRRKVAPPQLLDDHVAVDQDLAHVDRMVPAQFVVWHAFIFGRITVLEE